MGGHTVDDEEPKYGLSVTGVVRPGDHVTNAGAKPGDNLVLTKPIGTGVITTAAKQGVAPEDVLDTAVGIMSQLNDDASYAMNDIGVHACVDVTGFGLLGHLRGMDASERSGSVAELRRDPVHSGRVRIGRKRRRPGGTHRNLDSLEADVAWDDSITDVQKILLADAQTSGGLLIAVSDERLARCCQPWNPTVYRLGRLSVR